MDRYDCSEADISRSIENPVGRSYTCLGYPNSQNRIPTRSESRVRAKLRDYTGSGIPFDRLPGVADTNLHILIDFSFKFSRDENGVRVNSVKPTGFSGGAVIDLGRLSDPSLLTAPCNQS